MFDILKSSEIFQEFRSVQAHDSFRILLGVVGEHNDDN